MKEFTKAELQGFELLDDDIGVWSIRDSEVDVCSYIHRGLPNLVFWSVLARRAPRGGGQAESVPEAIAVAKKCFLQLVEEEKKEMPVGGLTKTGDNGTS